VTTSSNPDLAIRFSQSHLEPPEGVNAPVVPKQIWDDAQATKTMAARLKHVLRRQKGAASDMQARVDRLRTFIVDNAAAVVKQAEDLDTELTKRILTKHTKGPKGKQGAPGTPGLPGAAGPQGTDGSPGADGARGRREHAAPAAELVPQGMLVALAQLGTRVCWAPGVRQASAVSWARRDTNPGCTWQL